MTEKKEIKVKKSLLTLILKSIALSILTLFVIQHFGEISGGGDLYDGITGSPTNGQYIKTLPFEFENPINGEKYYEQYNHLYGIDRDRKETYLMKLKDFYLPSLFGNPIHILIGTILFAGIFAFFGKYKLKLS